MPLTSTAFSRLPMDIQTWLLFVAVAILPALSPGPGILLAVSNSIRFGPEATYYSAIGNALGLTILGFAVAFGLAALMAASAYALNAIKIVGAVYLIYLGVKLWWGGKALDIQAGVETARKTPRQLFMEALILALTNPKGLVLLTALLPPFVNHEHPVIPQVAIFSITFAVMAFCNHIFLAFAGSRLRHFLTSERRMLNVRRALGGLFVAFGAALALSTR